MIAREQLEAELDHLESMLPVWRERLRDEAQFWPQFNALSEEILMRADSADLDYARQRIEVMLAGHVATQTPSPLP